MKTIIIGGSGFIGTYLADKMLSLGYDIVVTGRNEQAKKYYENRGVPFVDLDICKQEDFQKLPQSKVEFVVLLASLLPANSKENCPYDYVSCNVIGTLNCLEYCRKLGVKKFLSTTSYADVRGFWQKNIAILDDSLRKYSLDDDHAAYVISKNAATDFILMYNQKKLIRCGIIFRLPMVYGVGPHTELYVDGHWYKSGFQIFIEKAMKGEDIEIFGDALTSRDVVYVKDVVDAVVLALQSPQACGLYNISSGVALTLQDQVLATIKIFDNKNKSTVIYRPEKKNNSTSFLLDITKAKTDFGYSPMFISFESLLEDYKLEMEKNRFPHLTNHYREK